MYFPGEFYCFKSILIYENKDVHKERSCFKLEAKYKKEKVRGNIEKKETKIRDALSDKVKKSVIQPMKFFS